jgi:hypothetical protein
MNLTAKELVYRFFVLGSFRFGFYLLQGLVYCLKQIFKAGHALFAALDRDLGKWIAICDYEMFGDRFEVISDRSPRPDLLEEQTNLLDLLVNKHALVIGETGSGKSTIATWLAYSVGGRVTVYEPEGCPGDWMGLEVIGRGEDWEAIDSAMQFDLDLLSQRVTDRLEKGDGAIAGTERVLIAEEFPEMRLQCSAAQGWIERHARRGRKLKQFLILISQFDRVTAWGLEGKSDLADCFIKIRLGKFAKAHAKKLKSPELLTWLAESRSHCLADDEPICLPSLAEMQRASQRFLPTSNALHNTFSEASRKVLEGSDQNDREKILEGLSEGLSDYQIVRHKLGVSGGSTYQKRKKEVEELRKAFESQQMLDNSDSNW